MDMARAIANGELSRAVNGYWSPLYPLFVSLFVRPFLDDPVGQFAAVRFANFLIFAATIGVFEILLRQLDARRTGSDQLDSFGWAPLSSRGFFVAAYAVFIWADIALIMVAAQIGPDRLVLAMLLLSVSAMLSLESGPASPRRFVVFGILLGIGYWFKTILFPTGVFFLAVAALDPALRGRKRLLFLSAVVFLVVAAPLVIAISIRCNRLTLGEASRLNYAWFVNDVYYSTHWQGGVPGQGEPKHPTRRIHSNPNVFEFAYPLDATFPPWAEPSYWYDGVEIHFDIRQQGAALYRNCRRFASFLVKTVLAPVLLILLVPALWRAWKANELLRNIRSMLRVWLVGLPIIGLYVLVYMSPRYVAGPLLLLSTVLITLIRTHGSGWATLVILVLLAASILSVRDRLGSAASRVISQRGNAHDDRWKVAEEFARLDVPPRTPVGSIGWVTTEDWAYPAQLRVVTEIAQYDRIAAGDATDFWRMSQDGQRRVLELMRLAGARIVVCNHVPPDVIAVGWTHIPDSPYYYVRLGLGAPY